MSYTDIIKQNIESMQKELGVDYWKVSASGIWFRKIFDQVLNEYSEGKLLDAGAGNLLYRPMLEDHCESYESLDISENPGLDYNQDIQNMELNDESYDTVFCRNVLEHVRKPREAMNEISRILKYDGKAIVSVPHLAYLHNEPEDYYRFTKYGMKEIASGSELEIIEIREAGGLFSFVGYIFSTVLIGLTYHLPVISSILFHVNYLVQLILSKIDCLPLFRRLTPLNYVLVYQKTE